MLQQNLTIILPNINSELLLQELQQEQSLPALKELLDRANKATTPTTSFSKTLGHLFKYSPATAIPIAAIEAKAADIVTQAPYWLRVDPIQLQVEHKGVYLLGSLLADLKQNEHARLLTELNELLQLEGLHLYGSSAQWYLALNSDPEIATYPLPQLIGKELSLYLPYGPKAKYWRKLFTEMQMVVYGSQVNQQRQAQGLPAIGGVWLWGEGSLPSLTAGVWQNVATNNLLAIGFAQLAEASVIALPANFAAYCSGMTTSGDYLVVLDELLGQTPGLALLQQWEQQWFVPLLQAIKTKQIARCSIYTTDGECFQIARRDFLSWWRRFLV